MVRSVMIYRVSYYGQGYLDTTLTSHYIDTDIESRADVS